MGDPGLRRLGLAIRARRKAAGISQTVFAEMIGYDGQSSVSRLESGESDIPQSVLSRVAAALKTSPCQLWAEADGMAVPRQGADDDELFGILHAVTSAIATTPGAAEVLRAGLQDIGGQGQANTLLTLLGKPRSTSDARPGSKPRGVVGRSRRRS